MEPISDGSISEDKGVAPNRKTLVRNNLIDFMTKNSSLNAASEEIVVDNYIQALEDNNKTY